MTENHENPTFAAVLLAAGPSTRLGQAKQLVQCDGVSMVRKGVRLLQELQPNSITVVTGYQSEDVEKEIADLPVHIEYNKEWSRGMGGSISCGVRKIPGNADGILLMVCDQWCLEVEDVLGLVANWKSDISRIYTACWHEGQAFVSGPPVIFPRKLKQELIFVKEDRGARQVIDRNMDIVEFVTMENAAHDLDRPEDLERLVKRSGQNPSS